MPDVRIRRQEIANGGGGGITLISEATQEKRGKAAKGVKPLRRPHV